MSDREQSAEAFQPDLQYPIWTLFDTAQTGAKFPEGIVPLTRRVGATTATVMVVFRDAAMAMRLISAIQKPMLAPVELQFPQQVIDALDHCQRAGATHVVINFELEPNETGVWQPKGDTVLLSDFRSALHKNPRTPGFSSN